MLLLGANHILVWVHGNGQWLPLGVYVWAIGGCRFFGCCLWVFFGGVCKCVCVCECVCVVCVCFGWGEFVCVREIVSQRICEREDVCACLCVPLHFLLAKVQIRTISCCCDVKWIQDKLFSLWFILRRTLCDRDLLLILCLCPTLMDFCYVP